MTSQGIPVLGVVSDARQILDACERLRPATIVADICMPPTMADNGLKAALEARLARPGRGVLVL